MKGIKLEEGKMPEERCNLFTEEVGWRSTMVIKLLFNDKMKKREAITKEIPLTLGLKRYIPCQEWKR